MKKRISVAVDGPSGSGKSTLAKMIASEMGMVYVDTGSLYRAIGLYILRRGIAPEDAYAITEQLPDINITMELVDGGSAVFLDGALLGDEIRTPACSVYASSVSKIPAVRAFLLDLQRSIAKSNSVVMDGRDIGTVILPDADVKIFLFASDEERAARRFAELTEKGIKTTYAEVLADMSWRDTNDRERKTAPAVPAPDATLLNNSGMSIKQTLDAALNIIREKLG